MSLFEDRVNTPLAERMRPSSLADVIGHEAAVGKGSIVAAMLEAETVTSMILWGPPGVGKTTIARIIAEQSGSHFEELSAVTSGVKDIKATIKSAKQRRSIGQQTIVFVDEIHRFNKAQQDAFLPHVESGLITLLGATTENPSFEVISPLLSRSKVITLQQLTEDDITAMLQRAMKQYVRGKTLTKAAATRIAKAAGGDGRVALNTLETAAQLTKKSIGVQEAEQAILSASLKYDKSGDQHYDTISAFIKSMRGSDVNATLFYLHRMLESGEDPLFIARRMVIFASEDIGMASPHALTLAMAGYQSVERIGMPEANYNLTHTAVAMAQAKKSRAVADALYASKKAVSQNPGAQVPKHLRNAVTKLMKDEGYGKGYNWKADFKHSDGFMPEGLEDMQLYESDF